MNKILLQCDNLSKRYGKSCLQTDVLQCRLQRGRGEMMAIVGSSGSGKSTYYTCWAGWIRRPVAT